MPAAISVCHRRVRGGRPIEEPEAAEAALGFRRHAHCVNVLCAEEVLKHEQHSQTGPCARRAAGHARARVGLSGAIAGRRRHPADGRARGVLLRGGLVQPRRRPGRLAAGVPQLPDDAGRSPLHGERLAPGAPDRGRRDLPRARDGPRRAEPHVRGEAVFAGDGVCVVSHPADRLRGVLRGRHTECRGHVRRVPANTGSTSTATATLASSSTAGTRTWLRAAARCRSRRAD